MIAILLLTLAGCGDEDDAQYTQFNADNDTIEVDVGVADVLPSRQADLHSNTGSELVGTVEVDPGGGPAETVVTISVRVDEAYADIVDRATVRTDSGSRGEDEYEMLADSANESLYWLELRAVAEPGETRTDVFTIRLWDAPETGDAEDDTAASAR